MDTNLAHEHEPLATRSPDERRQAGVALRRDVPRSAHGEWTPPADRADPVAILIEQGKSRIQELLPIRYGRMRADPFAFLRGAAAVMAADLARTPATGIRMQACGDAHLANFGSYATPEGLPVFDINDFDETLPAPFEWDLKRLATSLVVSGRVAQYSAKDCRKLALTAARTYREHIAELAALPPVVAWNRRIDLARAIADIDQPKVARRGGEAPRPGAGERRQALRPGREKGWWGPHPREATAGLPLEQACAAGTQGLRFLREDFAGGSPGAAAPPYSARRRVQGGRGRQRRHILRNRAPDCR